MNENGPVSKGGPVSDQPLTPAQERARARQGSGNRHLLHALVVLLVPVLVLGWLMTNKVSEPDVPAADWQGQLAIARDEAPYPVLSPTSVPPGWVPTTARWTKAGAPGLNREPSVRNLWELGFVSDQKIYLALTQGDLGAPQLIAEETRDGVPDGRSDISGAAWERYISLDGRTRSLVQRSEKVTSVVSGDTDYAALEAYVSTLTAG